MKPVNDIYFNQASFAIQNKDKIEAYQIKLQKTLAFFSKRTFMQIACHNEYYRLIDLSEPMNNGDYSSFLFDELSVLFNKTDKLLGDVENIDKGISKFSKNKNK